MKLGSQLIKLIKSAQLISWEILSTNCTLFQLIGKLMIPRI